MKPPPRDAAGCVLPHDHDEILEADGLIRRISEKQTVNDKDGNRMVSSLAFKPSSGLNGGLSVDLETLILEAKLDPKAFVTTPRWTASIRFTAGALRELNCQVGYDPLPPTEHAPANPFHGEVWFVWNKASGESLRAVSEWYVPMPDTKLKA